MERKILLMSIRPVYANKIFSGEKTVELRRVKPKYISKGDLALVYASSPVKCLVGAFTIKKIIEKPIPRLWRSVEGKAGISKEDFYDYFRGASTGVGIFIDNYWAIGEQPIALDELREKFNGFTPPQSFRYATKDESKLVVMPYYQDDLCF